MCCTSECNCRRHLYGFKEYLMKYLTKGLSVNEVNILPSIKSHYVQNMPTITRYQRVRYWSDCQSLEPDMQFLVQDLRVNPISSPKMYSITQCYQCRGRAARRAARR